MLPFPARHSVSTTLRDGAAVSSGQPDTVAVRTHEKEIKDQYFPLPAWICCQARGSAPSTRNQEIGVLIVSTRNTHRRLDFRSEFIRLPELTLAESSHRRKNVDDFVRRKNHILNWR